MVADLGSDLVHVVMAMDGRYGAAEQITASNVTYLKMDSKKGRGAPNFRRFRDALKSEQPSHLVTYNFGALEWVISSIGLKIPHTHVEEGFTSDEATKRKTSRNITRAVCLNSFGSTLVVVSETIRTIALKEWFLGSKQIKLIPNGVDASVFLPRLEGKASLYKDCANEVVIGTAARLRPEKRLDRLLEAFALLIDHPDLKNKAIRLVVAGDGPERNSLLKLSHALGLAEKVEFLGFRDDLFSVLPNIDIFCLSSDTEQMPIALIEAMACGLPCVCTDVGDVKKIASEENQNLITPKDATQLAEKLLLLCNDGPLREFIGKANRERAVKNFSKTTMLKQWRARYSLCN